MDVPVFILTAPLFAALWIAFDNPSARTACVVLWVLMVAHYFAQRTAIRYVAANIIRPARREEFEALPYSRRLRLALSLLMKELKS